MNVSDLLISKRINPNLLRASAQTLTNIHRQGNQG